MLLVLSSPTRPPLDRCWASLDPNYRPLSRAGFYGAVGVLAAGVLLLCAEYPDQIVLWETYVHPSAKKQWWQVGVRVGLINDNHPPNPFDPDNKVINNTHRHAPMHAPTHWHTDTSPAHTHAPAHQHTYVSVRTHMFFCTMAAVYRCGRHARLHTHGTPRHATFSAWHIDVLLVPVYVAHVCAMPTYMHTCTHTYARRLVAPVICLLCNSTSSTIMLRSIEYEHVAMRTHTHT